MFLEGDFIFCLEEASEGSRQEVGEANASEGDGEEQRRRGEVGEKGKGTEEAQDDDGVEANWGRVSDDNDKVGGEGGEEEETDDVDEAEAEARCSCEIFTHAT